MNLEYSRYEIQKGDICRLLNETKIGLTIEAGNEVVVVETPKDHGYYSEPCFLVKSRHEVFRFGWADSKDLILIRRAASENLFSKIISLFKRIRIKIYLAPITKN